MNTNLHRRLAAIEAKINHGKSSIKDVILEILRRNGFAALREVIGRLRWPGSENEVSVEVMLHIAVGMDHTGLEEFRGRRMMYCSAPTAYVGTTSPDSTMSALRRALWMRKATLCPAIV